MKLTKNLEDPNKETDALVTVVCITYNHKNTIRQCIDSLLDQSVSFKYRIIIHDDASNDGTTEIIKEYKDKFPELITLIIQKHNQYSKGLRPSLFIVNEIASKYVAICEGDDYWTDKRKLRTQIEVLEKDEDVGMVVHPASELDYVTGLMSITGRLATEDCYVDPRTIITKGGGVVPTASIAVRAEIYRDATIFSKGAPVGDFFIQVYAAVTAKIYYIDEAMSFYRKFQVGSWTERNKQKKIRQKYFRDMVLHVDNFIIKLSRYPRSKLISYPLASYVLSAVRLYEATPAAKVRYMYSLVQSLKSQSRARIFLIMFWKIFYGLSSKLFS